MDGRGLASKWPRPRQTQTKAQIAADEDPLLSDCIRLRPSGVHRSTLNGSSPTSKLSSYQARLEDVQAGRFWEAVTA